MTAVATVFLQSTSFINAAYIVAFSLLIYGMMGLTGPRTAVRGNKIAATGMAIAVIATLLRKGEFSHSSTIWLILLGAVIGTAIGIPAARNVKMTAMPQMVALFNGVGGGAVALIAWVEYRHAFGGGWPLRVEIFELFGAIVGSISFWGSGIAFGKLQEILPGRPIKLPGRAQVGAEPGTAGDRARARDRARVGHPLGGAVHRRDPGRLGGAGNHGGAADRRRRHAGRDLAAERLHRPLGGRHRRRAVKPGDDRRAG